MELDLKLTGWIWTTINVLVYLIIIRKKPYMMVRASFSFLGFYILTLEVPAAFNYEQITSIVTEPWEFIVLVHCVPTISIPFIIMTMTKITDRIRIRLKRVVKGETFRKEMMTLALAIGVILAGYLLAVPWARTGLVVAITGSGDAIDAREQSFKLLSNPLVRYSFSIMARIMVPALLACVVGRIVLRTGMIRFVSMAPLVLFGLIACSIYGSRGYSVIAIITAAYVYWCYQKFDLKPKLLIFAIIGTAAVLCLPTLISLARAGYGLDQFGDSYLNTIERSTSRNIVSTLWHVDYSQRFGHMGIAGIPKIAALFGVEGVNAGNIVGLTYFAGRIQSINASSSFVFQYFGFFDWGFVLLIPFLILSLDVSLFLLRYVPDYLLHVAIGVNAGCSFTFAITGYTTALITNGFLLVIPVIITLAWFTRRVLTPPRHSALLESQPYLGMSSSKKRV
ncbi:hypothetical protein N8592_00845 [Verrucomicrobia bacterium]|nr:hypothetical protein [Verrucomicrobiota bacterium]